MTNEILFLHPSDELYGADRVLLRIVGALGPQSSEVWLPTDVAYPDRLLSAALDDCGARVRNVSLPVLRRAKLNVRGLLGLLPSVASTFNEIRRSRAKLVYINTTALVLAAPLAWLLRRRVIVHVHESLQGPIRIPMFALLAFGSRLICVSEAVERDLPSWLRKRSTVLYNGFDIPAPSPQRSNAGSPTTIEVLLASRWNSWKGHSAFLAAWAAVNRRDLKLVLAGGPPKSGDAAPVHQMVVDLGLSESVEFIGEVVELRPFLDSCDVVVVPSVRPDPLPTIAIEAAGSGRACIGSDVGGLPEIIRDGETGWLLPPTDVNGWAELLDALDMAEVRRRGVNARELFQERFSAPRFDRDIQAIVRELEALKT